MSFNLFRELFRYLIKYFYIYAYREHCRGCNTQRYCSVRILQVIIVSCKIVVPLFIKLKF